MTLKDLPAGKAALITAVGGEGALRQHFLDMGVIPGSEIVLVKYAPMGDPIQFMIHGYELTLRTADAEKVEIENVHELLPAAEAENLTPETLKEMFNFIWVDWNTGEV